MEGRHCEYHGLEYVHTVPATQDPLPLQPWPPHCDQVGNVPGAEDVALGVEDFVEDELATLTTATFEDEDEVTGAEDVVVEVLDGDLDVDTPALVDVATTAEDDFVNVANVELGVDLLDAFVVEAGTDDEEVLTTAATLDVEVLNAPGDAGDQNTAGVYTGIGSVTPYPATPHAGLAGGV